MSVSLDGSSVSIVNQEETITLNINGYINLVLVDGRYDIDASLSLEGLGIEITLDVKMVNNVIYLTVLNNNIKISVEEIEMLIEEITNRFNLSLEMGNEELSLDLESLDLYLSEELISVNLTDLVDMGLLVSIAYGLNEEGFNADIVVDSEQFDINLPVKLSKIDSYEITLPEECIDYEDMLVILDNVEYIYNLINSGKLHISLEDVLVEVTINEALETISINGEFDLLIEEEFALDGYLSVECFGVKATLGVKYYKEIIYLIISNQVIGIKITEIESFINDVMAKLEPIIGTVETVNEEETEENIDLGDLGLVIRNNSIVVSLTELLDTVLDFSILYGLSLDSDNLANSMGIVINGNYNNEVSFNGNINITESTIEEIVIPTKYLNEDDVFELLDFVLVIYGYKDQRKFELDLDLTIYTNGNLTMDINGSLFINILENEEFDLRIKANIIEYKNNEKSGWHQVDLNVISLTTLLTMDPNAKEAMMYGYYGNNEADPNAVLKIKSTFTGVENLITSALSLLNINTSEIITIESESFNIDNILSYLRIEKDVLSIGLNGSTLFEAMLQEEQVFDISIHKNDDSILGITAENVYVSYTNLKENTKIGGLSIMLVDTGMNVECPANPGDYYDISNISYLIEGLYHNATQKDFKITGDVTLTAIGMVSVDVPIEARIIVTEDGKFEIYAHIDMSDLGIAGSLSWIYKIASEKHVYIYYKDEYVYIHRDDLDNDKDDKMVKIHYTEFMDNIVYYLLDYAMGLHNDILGAIYGDGTTTDGLVDASKCVTEVNMTQTTFKFGLDMIELTGNTDLGPLVAELATTMVAKKDESGSYEYDEFGNIVYSPMIHAINKFSFELVSVISLHSESLTLSNIYAGDDGVVTVHPVDMTPHVSFINDFNNKYNADEEYVYSNGKWVSNGKISHRVIFNMDEAGVQIGSYKEGQLVGFPTYKDNVIKIEQDGQIIYYEILGWYYDPSYLKPITDFNIYMNNSSLQYYALVEDVTVCIKLNSSYNGNNTIITYRGANITETVNNLYNIYRTDSGLYKFTELKDSLGNSYDMSDVADGDISLNVIWEYVEYDFYAYYNDNEILLDDTSNSTFTNNDVVVYMNNVYYVYSGSKMTQSYVISNFASLFTLNDEDRRFEIMLFTEAELQAKGYHEVTFDAPTKFNNKQYKGIFIKQGEVMNVTNYAPNGVYGSFEINAWVVTGEAYLSLVDLSGVVIDQAYTITPYVATRQDLFTFVLADSGASITGYSGTDTTVIFPRYALIGANYYVVTELSTLVDASGNNYSAFTGNTTVNTVVFNEGLKAIGANAFKDCLNIRNIYFSSTITSVAGDAFYITAAGNHEKNRDVAQQLRFYIPSGSVLSKSNWLATYHTSEGPFYYGNKGRYMLWIYSYDYSNAFQKNTYTAFTKSLEIARSL